jgi:hypothetical protein
MQFLLNGTYQTVWDINGTLNASLISVQDLRAENIISGKLTLYNNVNNGQFVFNNTVTIDGKTTTWDNVKIDSNGVKAINIDNATVSLLTGRGEGISAKSSSNVEYFSTNPDTQKTIIKNGEVTEELQLGTDIKIKKITNGIAFIVI